VLLLATIDLLVLGLLAWPMLQAQGGLFSLRQPTDELISSPLPASPTATLSEFPTPSIAQPDPPSLPTVVEVPLFPIDLKQGLIILALREGADTHLFAYAPEVLPLTRLTSGAWDDIQPAVSPDGTRIAFASNRSGYWDLYSLEIATGEITNLTNSLEYDAAPAWSPDGIWLVYETYIEDNLELMLLSAAGDQTAIRLTYHPAADHSPAWSPLGREIAFVSTRSGEPEIWIANLDQADDQRFQNISRAPQAFEAHPTWQRDGAGLVWAATQEGRRELRLWEVANPGVAQPIGSGDWPVWSPDGQTLLALLLAPNQATLTAYDLKRPTVFMPPINLETAVAGLDWAAIELPRPMPEKYRPAVLLTPSPAWLASTIAATAPGGRERVVTLPEGIEAPHAMLHDAVDESFRMLRDRLAIELGWDFLGALENAYVPLTSMLDPGMAESWLYTGRAFAANTLPLNAGWMVVVREDFGSDTYWRVYLRARFQDGSAGAPLHDQPWDFNPRFTDNAAAYERGGLLMADIPTGYWLDFTEYARSFGWERQPAQVTWRTAYTGARFNEFALTGGLDWRSAMLALYPLEALQTPTVIIPPTRTPTTTPRWYQTPTPSLTYTPRPTYTPAPPSPTTTRTSRPTPTPSPTRKPSKQPTYAEPPTEP
jgi:TolB protein